MDDNKFNSKLASKILKDLGFQVTLVYNGYEAIKICKDYDFDVILMDLNMPVVDGFQATSSLLKIKPFLKIIAFTANSTVVINNENYSNFGFVGLVNKPFTRDELIRVLGNVIEVPVK